MKKIVEMFNGSPRKRGNTQVFLDALCDQFEDLNYKVEQTRLYDIDLSPCIDCRACKTGDKDCIVQDGMQKLYTRLEKADMIIFGTPIYWFGPSAVMKGLMDRLRPYYKNEKLKGKKAILVTPAGNGALDWDLTIEMFKRTFVSLGIEFVGAVTSESYDIGDAAKDFQGLKQIDIIIKSLYPQCS